MTRLLPALLVVLALAGCGDNVPSEGEAELVGDQYGCDSATKGYPGFIRCMEGKGWSIEWVRAE